MGDVRAPAGITTLHDAAAAELLLDPLRSQLTAHAAEPISATQLGEHMDQPRQKINYHVHKLAEAGLLERAGSRPRRGFTEKLYQATAEAYLISPSLLGPLAPDPSDGQDAFSAGHLLALVSRTQSELSQVLADAREDDERVATLSIDATVHFASPTQRAAFTQALEDAIARILRKHTAGVDEDGQPQAGTRPFRFLITSHPVPPSPEEDTTDDA